MLFQQTKLMRLRLCLLVVMSVLLMFYDQQQKGLMQLRGLMLTLVSPLQSMATLPVELINKIKANTVSHQTLLEENTQLRAEALIMKANMQRIVSLQQENNQLRELLLSTTDMPQRYMAARLLAVANEPHISQILIDRGAHHNVYIGQPVLDAKGVMGQVIQTGQKTSRVMLLTDSNSAVPSLNQRTNERGIIVGMGDHQLLRLLNMTDSADIRVGDVFITSGLGMRYPPGYPVGVVEKINQKKDDNFLEILIKPTAGINRSRQVLLVWQPEQKEIHEGT